MLVIQRVIKFMICLVLLLPLSTLMATQPTPWIVDEAAILPYQACQRLNLKLTNWQAKHEIAIAVLVVPDVERDLDEHSLERLLANKFKSLALESSKKIIYLVVDAKHYQGWLVSRVTDESTVLFLHKVNQEVLLPTLKDKQLYKAVWETVTALTTYFDGEPVDVLQQHFYQMQQWLEHSRLKYFLKALQYVLFFSGCVLILSRLQVWWYGHYD